MTRKLFIGLGAVGAGGKLAYPEVQGGDGNRDGAVGITVVGQEPPHHDAVGRVPRHGSRE